MIRLTLGLVIVILIQSIWIGLIISQPTRELIEIIPSPNDVVIDELVDEVTHFTKVKVKITVKLAKGEKLIINWTGIKRYKNEFYLEVEMYKLKGVQDISAKTYVEEKEFELGKLEGGVYKVHVIVNGKLVKTGILVVSSESGESRTFSPKPEHATIFLALIALILTLILVKYLTTR